MLPHYFLFHCHTHEAQLFTTSKPFRNYYNKIHKNVCVLVVKLMDYRHIVLVFVSAPTQRFLSIVISCKKETPHPRHDEVNYVKALTVDRSCAKITVS